MPKLIDQMLEIQRDTADLIDRGNKLAAKVQAVTARVTAMHRSMEGEEPPPARRPTREDPPHADPPPVTKSTPRPPVDLADDLEPFPDPEEDSPAFLATMREAAAECRLLPSVVHAIEWQETGHYKHPKAGPWHKGKNPGGMKFSEKVAEEVGALSEPYVAADGSARYLAFATRRDGIIGHGRFLARSNYNSARKPGLSGRQQVRAIWEAKYSELSPTWLENVTKFEAEVAHLYEGSAPEVVTNIIPIERGAAIVARARIPVNNLTIHYRQAVGEGADDPSAPLPGSMVNGEWVCDCSLYLAWVYGYVREDTGLNTDGIVSDVRGRKSHFRQVTGPARPGMAYVYGKHGDYSYGHCGVITEVDANGVPTKVAHCHGPTDGPPPAIQETGPGVFIKGGAIIVEYIGPLAA